LDVIDESAPDSHVSAVRGLVSSVLLDRELDTLTVIAGERSLLVSFHASLEHRLAVLSLLSELDAGGFYAVDSRADATAQALGKLIDDQQLVGFALRPSEGGPLLVERTVHAGDMLSRDDVRVAVSDLEGLVRQRPVAGARWGFEVLLGAEPPVVRAWLLETRGAVDFRDLREITHHNEGATLVIEGELLRSGRDVLEGLTNYRKDVAVALLVGDEVLTAPIVTGPITDGKFVLRIRHGAGDETLGDRLERMRNAPSLASSVRFDAARTARIERDITCLLDLSNQASCGCVEGHCAWRETDALRACVQGDVP
jgi:hypothetical protein